MRRKTTAEAKSGMLTVGELRTAVRGLERSLSVLVGVPEGWALNGQAVALLGVSGFSEPDDAPLPKRTTSPTVETSTDTSSTVGLAGILRGLMLDSMDGDAPVLVRVPSGLRAGADFLAWASLEGYTVTPRELVLHAVNRSPRLVVECAAETIHGRAVGLPEGTEVPISSGQAYRWAAAHPRAKTMDLMCRCPGAKNPAPYHVDVSDLLLALPR